MFLWRTKIIESAGMKKQQSEAKDATLFEVDGICKSGKGQSCILSGEDEIKHLSHVMLYSPDILKEVLFWCGVFLTGGLWYIILKWFEHLMNKMRYSPTTNYIEAYRAVLYRHGEPTTIIKVKIVSIPNSEYNKALGDDDKKLTVENSTNGKLTSTVIFEYYGCKYIMDIRNKKFVRYLYNIGNYGPEELYSSHIKGIQNRETVQYRKALYGQSIVDVPVQSLWQIIFEELFHPIYFFQMLAISLWLYDEYYQYAGAIIVVTSICFILDIYDIRHTQLKLHEMAKLVCDVEVLRADDTFTTISSVDLVPGDLVRLTKGMLLPCDIILLKGYTLVNESLLTGETVPVAKSTIREAGQLKKDDVIPSSHILFAGTEIIETNRGISSNSASYELGVVIRTGFDTTQGQMINCLIYQPMKTKDQLYKDTYKFLLVLFCLSLVCAIATLIVTLFIGLRISVVLIRCLDTFTNGVPPALPTTMRVGTSFAVLKLKKQWSVLCISTCKINLAGQVNTVVMDKTGTLTEDTLDLAGVMFSDDQSLKEDSSFNKTHSESIKSLDNGAKIKLAKIVFETPQIAQELRDINSNRLREELRDSRTLESLNTKRNSSDKTVSTLIKSGHVGNNNAFVQIENLAHQTTPQSLAHQTTPQPLAHQTTPQALVHKEKLSNFQEPVYITPVKADFSGVSCGANHDLPALVGPVDEISKVPFLVRLSMAVCHSLLTTNYNQNQHISEIPGDPMEVKLFQFSRFKFLPRCSEDVAGSNGKTFLLTKLLSSFGDVYTDEVNDLATKPCRPCGENGSHNVYRIIRRFDFIPALQRMSVIIWCLQQNRYYAICKGSPEAVQRLCRKNTIPQHFSASLKTYAQEGFRVLAYGFKEIQFHGLEPQKTANALKKYKRSDVESDLIFSAFIFFTNRLKKGSKESVGELLNSRCRCLMATGDNALTALSVATQLRIVTNSKVILGDVKDSLEFPKTKLSWNIIDSKSESFCKKTSKYQIQEKNISQIYSVEESDLSTEKDWVGERNLSESKSTEDTICSLLSKKSLTILSRKVTSEITPDLIINSQKCGDTRNDLTEEELIVKKEEENEINMVSQCYETLNMEALNSLIEGHDPRKFSLVLTGPAFRLIKECSEKFVVNSKDSIFYELGTNGNDCIIPMLRSNKTNIFDRKRSRWGIGGIRALKRRFLFSERSENIDHRKKLLHKKEALFLKIKTQRKKIYGTRKCSAFLPFFHGKTKVGEKNNLDNPFFSVMNITLFEYCVRFCRVFARMNPEDKALLVSSIRALPSNPVVCMCGDGANDCKALRTADVGISLSKKEASMAAPFTSSNGTIKSCLDVLREGRGAIVNSFQSFKFIALYALIQLVSTTLLFFNGNNLTDAQYFWMDLIVVMPLSITMAWTNSSTVLSDTLPSRKLVGAPIIATLLGQTIIQSLCLFGAVEFLKCQEFYEPFIPSQDIERFEDDDLECQMNTVVFLVSNLQTIGLNYIFTRGHPWRKSRLTNIYYTLCLLFSVGISFAILLVPDLKGVNWISDYLTIIRMPLLFRVKLLGLIFACFFSSYAFHTFFINGILSLREEEQAKSAHFIDVLIEDSPEFNIEFSRSAKPKKNL